MSGDKTYWDNVAHNYDSLYQSEWSIFEDSVLRADLQRVLEMSNGKRVLDIGCGTGLAYQLLGGNASGIDYVGLDNSEAMLSELSRRYPEVKAIKSSGDAFGSRVSCNFDLVISINVAASFPMNTSEMLRDVFRVLGRGGIFYLSFLNRASLRRMLRLKFGSLEQYRTRGDKNSKDFVLANVFTRSHLTRMFLSAGFSEVHCSYRSVLGGVWESTLSTRLEPVIARILPWLGHSIVVSGVRV